MSPRQTRSAKTESPAARQKLSAGRKLLFALATVTLFFVVVEGLLRVAGIQIVSDVEEMEFTFPIDDYNNSAPEPFLRRDPELFWTPRPGVAGHNSLGFIGPEFSPEKPDDVFRIVCIGDSCTHFGPQSYPEILQQLLDQARNSETPNSGALNDRKVEVINAGVIGYTSYQGLTLMRSKVANWQPDLVTVYFGWNDHWLARGLEDNQQTNNSPGTASRMLGSLRSVQLARMLTGGLTADGQPKPRVALTDYRSNLTEIANLCRSLKCQCWFITAPHAMDLSIPDYLMTSGEVADPSQLIPLHQSYNAAVREVAERTASSLIDLESSIDALPKQSLFLEDHIHFTLAGRRYAAEQIAAKIGPSIGTE